MKAVLVIVLAVSVFLPAVYASASTPLKLPKNYHSWQKSSRKVVTDKNSLFYGVHYIYADKKGMQGYRSGGRFPEGSTIVVDFYNIGANPSVDGARNMIALMRKDRRAKETGGWIFAGYGPDGKPNDIDPATVCFGCHKKDASDRGYVISTLKDFQK